ncbi:YdeI/OmpD-associated family protein [Paenibacillus koleovorans]|uniref:YdeI/OmpD-associated family protein n=1 Tax=Paenibacillus koleovorans TaxID=121608 RepID=UPI000FD74D83|nr:YdeI/OmpD-associated family protein [Paenibacillus koleovorans]
MERKDGLPIRLFATQDDLEAWLADNHVSSPGMWLQIAKKGSGIVSVTYLEALDVALCYGWVDSQKDKFDERTYLQRFTPRGARSIWSQVNVAKVEGLIASGKMQPAGLRTIEIAKAGGQWDRAYAPASSAEVPDDLAAALALNAKAKERYESLTKSGRYTILFRLQNVKKAETRERKIREFVDKLEKGEPL